MGHLDKRFQARIISRLEILAHEPRPTGSKKLTRYDYWRIRVGEYRIVYQIEDDARRIVILLIRHRRDAYRNLQRLDATRFVEFLGQRREGR